MPPALDRLLASPSALRLLRTIVNSSELPIICGHPRRCHGPPVVHRNYSTDKKTPEQQSWRRWKRSAQDVLVGRNMDDQSLEGNLESSPTPADLGRVKKVISGDVHFEDDTSNWAENLALCERLNGKDGIVKSWEARLSMNYDLPIEDTPEAEYLWGTYAKHRALMSRVIQHAADLKRKTGKIYPRLYELIMDNWLRRHPTLALTYHKLMLEQLEPEEIPIKALARSCRSAGRTDAYAVFMTIYRNTNERTIYDEVVPSLLELGEISIARRWHKLCVSRGDTPSESVASSPIVQMLNGDHTNLGVEAGVESKRAQREARKFNRELLKRLAGRDTAPVRFEDSFCARMFATRTFPPDSVIKGLAMVGVNEIGPQAVRTMASRTDPIEELPRMFEELRTNGITLQGCVFSLALEQFAIQQRWQLVYSMLDSDQHPDVFADAEVQRKLLNYYLEQNDHQQIQRTLAVLTLFHNDSSRESWNLLLQTHIKLSGPDHVPKLLDDMRVRQIMVTPETVTAIRGLLRRRQSGKRPSQRSPVQYDDLRLVSRAFVTILESGIGYVSPLYWREIIRRLGISGRFRELRRLVRWLLCWYAPRGNTQFSTLPHLPFLEPARKRLKAAFPETNHYFHFPPTVTQQENEHHPVRQLFPASLQAGLISWGFKAGLLPNASHEQSMYGSTLAKIHYRRRLLDRQQLNRMHWKVGLKLVVELRDLGVYVHPRTVVKALQQQFIVLFGYGKSRRKENRIMEQVNTMPYSAYVQEVNETWGSPLFVDPETLANGVSHDYVWHPRMRRRPNGSGWISMRKRTLEKAVSAHSDAL